MQNAKLTTAYILLSLSVGAIATYAMTPKYTSDELREIEKRTEIIRCLESIDTEKSTSQELIRATQTCSKAGDEKKEEVKTKSGTVSPANSGVPGQKEELARLKQKVCEMQQKSPICTEGGLIERLYAITEERIPGKNFFPILLGITNAESSLGVNYANDNIGGKCSGRFNMGGAKWRKTDSGESIKDQKIPDEYGCWLYRFNSYDDYWISKVNTIRFGYKSCIDSDRPIFCISGAYVGNRYVHEQSWINNVSIFLP